jgi:hypothetical protein
MIGMGNQAYSEQAKAYFANMLEQLKIIAEAGPGGGGSDLTDLENSNDSIDAKMTTNNSTLSSIDSTLSGGIDINSLPAATENPVARDAFSRLRVSNPVAVFDAQFTYDLHPLLYEQITSGTGDISYFSAGTSASMNVSANNDEASMQTYQHFRYQPGKSQLVFLTFNMLGQDANVTKSIGYTDGTDGMLFEVTGSTVAFKIVSSTGVGTQTALQANWNLDTLDGAGPSGLTLDTSSTQILVIDFQALYVGRVRMGFDINGEIIYSRIIELHEDNCETGEEIFKL